MLVDRVIHTRARVTAYLESRGFAECAVPEWARSHRAASYAGDLMVQGKPHRTVATVQDWDFCTPPTICLMSGSPLIKGGNPHIGLNGAICYRTDGFGVLNAFAPEHAMASCLEQVEEVLRGIQSDPTWRRDEIQREFASYWDGHTLLSCGLDFARKEAQLLIAEDNDRVHGWLYQDDQLAHSIVTSMGMQSKVAAKVFLLNSGKPLVIDTNGRPTNLKALLRWLHEQDRTLEQRILDAMSTKDFFRHREPIVVIQSLNATIAFSTSMTSSAQQYFNRRPREFPHRARHPHLPPLGIERYTVSDASPEHIYSRNGQNSLRGRKIVLIGAGSIGGYLADNLVRMGAGFSGGRLTVIDPESLQPENIGRHRLGIDSVFKNKAIALADRLKREFPWVDIRSETMDARSYGALFRSDLIIDATGEEALGRAINREHQARKNTKPVPPVLYCWIAGEGEGAQSLWVEANGEHACWECLLIHTKNGDWHSRFQFVRHETQLRSVGCGAITPYGASAAMCAAALASEAVADWLSGRTRPYFRSRHRSHADVNARPDSSPDRLKSCPACCTT